jgi:hypothetical protein
MDFIRALDEVFPVKAENSRIGGAALAEEGSHRVTEDNEPWPEVITTR